MKDESGQALIILSPGFPSNEMESTCLPPQQVFVRSLKKSYPELEITVVTFQYPFRSDDYQWNGVRVISLNGRNKGNVNRLWLWMRAWMILKKLNRKNNLVGLLSFWCTECSLVGH